MTVSDGLRFKTTFEKFTIELSQVRFQCGDRFSKLRRDEESTSSYLGVY